MNYEIVQKFYNHNTLIGGRVDVIDLINITDNSGKTFQVLYDKSLKKIKLDPYMLVEKTFEYKGVELKPITVFLVQPLVKFNPNKPKFMIEESDKHYLAYSEDGYYTEHYCYTDESLNPYDRHHVNKKPLTENQILKQMAKEIRDDRNLDREFNSYDKHVKKIEAEKQRQLSKSNHS